MQPHEKEVEINTPPEGWEAAINEGQRLRGWIANSYAQIEYLFGDLILRCRAYPEYADQTKTFTHSAPKRVEKVRNIIATPGPLTPYATDLLALAERFERGHETRNLLAHGFCEFLFTTTGDTGFYFQKFHRQPGRDEARLVRTLTPEAMQQEADTFVALADEALKLFARIHAHFGWIGLRPSLR